jgi:hypothetical protein
MAELTEKDMNLKIIEVIQDRLQKATHALIEKTAEIAREDASDRIYSHYEQKEDMEWGGGGFKFGRPSDKRQETIRRLEKELVGIQENVRGWKQILNHAIEKFV